MVIKNEKLVKTAKSKYQKAKEEFGSMQYGSEVYIEPSVARRGETIRVNYQGLLKNSGAQSVYLHYGFDQWNSPQTMRMERSEDGIFRADVHVSGSNEMNFCFKDCANNWDNNSGHNWNIPLH